MREQTRLDMNLRLWEWAVTHGTRDGACGVSMTCRGAMDALSRTLVNGDTPARGCVTPVALVDGAWEAFYLHEFPERIADYDRGVIRWALTSNTHGGRVSGDPPPRRDIDVSIPSPARMYDFYLGGKHNFPADREAAQRALSVVPHGQEIARANRHFLVRVVKHLARSGIDQFIDIGTGIPASPNVHEVARSIIPDARVIYIDNDADVTIQNREILAGMDSGVRGIYGDIRYPLNVVYDQALREVIDFNRPVGVLFVAVLHFLTNGDDPYNSVNVFTQRIAPGSYVAISHITSDGTSPEVISTIQKAYAHASAPAIFRTKKEIEVLFNGLELLKPGFVEVSDWRSNGKPRPDPALRLLAGVGRKRGGLIR
jgi:hypothetical protein